MQYKDFVQKYIKSSQLANLKQTDKMKKIGEMWRQFKLNGHEPQGGNLGEDMLAGMHDLFGLGLKKKAKPRRTTQGAGFFGDLGNTADTVGHLFGFGMEGKKQRKPRKKAQGAGLFGDIGNAADGIGHMFGLGLEGKKKGKPRRRTRKDEMQGDGKGLLGSIVPFASLLGLGLQGKNKDERRIISKMAKRKKAHGGQIVGGGVHLGKMPYGEAVNTHGGNIFDSFLSGVATPFRLAANINPIFGFGVDKIADGLGVPQIQDVINS